MAIRSFVHTNSISYQIRMKRRNLVDFLIKLSPFDDERNNKDLILGEIDLQDNSYFSLFSSEDWGLFLAEDINVHPFHNQLSDPLDIEYCCYTSEVIQILNSSR